MKGYWVVLVYPIAPAAAGVLMGTYPLALAALLVAGAAAWVWKARKRPVLDILMPAVTVKGFSRLAAAFVVIALLVQAVASFLLGLGAVAGWPVAWLVPYSILPSCLLAAAVYLKLNLLR